MNYVVGYISGELRYVHDMLGHFGWRMTMPSKRRFTKDGRCIHWVGEEYQLHGIEGKGKKFLAVRGARVSERFAASRRFTIVQNVDDFLKEDS